MTFGSVCSTPFGILYVGTADTRVPLSPTLCAQRLSASYMLEHDRDRSLGRRGSSAQRLSASYMLEPTGTGAWGAIDRVLNAFRHLICWNAIRSCRPVLQMAGAQRLSASYMLELPASKRLGWLGFFMLLARTPLSQAGLRGTPENFPAPVLQVPDVSVIFSFSGIPSSSEFIFPQRIQAVGCSSDIVTPNILRCMIPEIFRMSHDTEAWLLRGPLDPGVPRNQLRRTRVAQPRNHQTVFRG